MEVCWAEKKILFYFSDVISRKKNIFPTNLANTKKNEKSWATIAQLFVIEKTKFSN